MWRVKKAPTNSLKRRGGFPSEPTLLVTNEINHFVGMTIEEPWQAVPGEWQMQILRGDTVLAEQSFQLYRP